MLSHILQETAHAVNTPPQPGQCNKAPLGLLKTLLKKIELQCLQISASLIAGRGDRRQQLLAAALRAAIDGDEEAAELCITAAVIASPRRDALRWRIADEGRRAMVEELRREQ